MLIQISLSPQTLAMIIIIIGIILVVVGLVMASSDGEKISVRHRESKAIIFIGPIPLVWGFSRRTQILLGIIAILIFSVWVVLTF